MLDEQYEQTTGWAIGAARQAVRAARDMRQALVLNRLYLPEIREHFLTKWFPEIMELAGKEIEGASFEYSFPVPEEKGFARVAVLQVQHMMRGFLERRLSADFLWRHPDRLDVERTEGNNACHVFLAR